MIRRLLCLLGFHSFELVEAALEFREGGSVEKVRCRRCGVVKLRRSRA